MIQVKIFVQFNQADKLETAINEWLRHHPEVVVKDVKFSNSLATTTKYDDGDSQLGALIVYYLPPCGMVSVLKDEQPS